MLKLATDDDYNELVRVGILGASMYQPEHGEVDVDKLLKMINLFLSEPNETSVILMYMEGDKAVGVLAVRAEEALWHKGKIAQEIFYYIDPESKNLRIHNQLLEAYIYWCRRIGVTKAVMSCTENTSVDRVSKAYKRKGFRPLERYFIKEL